MTTAADEALRRHVEYIDRHLGSICDLLNDPLVTDVIRNSDGTLHVTRAGHGTGCVGKFDYNQAKGLIDAIASHVGQEARYDSPLVQGEIPGWGCRFQGVVAPCVPGASFAIRQPAKQIYALTDYLEQGAITPRQQRYLETAIVERKNILVVGGTGAGKTTLLNALIKEAARLTPSHRFVIIEDTKELQCVALNKEMLRTSQNVSQRDLLKATLRMFPDRIIVGEVRDEAALDMLEAWNTGHDGGFGTIHSNTTTPEAALLRLEFLVQRATTAPPQRLIGEAVDLIVCIERRADGGRLVSQIVSVNGYVRDGYQLTKQE